VLGHKRLVARIIEVLLEQPLRSSVDRAADQSLRRHGVRAIAAGKVQVGMPILEENAGRFGS
jgi:hypothetical protein